MESAREYDINEWPEIKGNPISKVGVFQYSGSQIDPSLDPDKIYNVYRSEEELSDSETIESFKLLPWINEHEMLGSEEFGLTPAERKGVWGVIGEQVYFEFPYLKANIKTFSEKMKELFELGKIQLSAAYRCVYERASGVYNDQAYEFVQKKIRGNHLALVDEGRMGRDVAVMDEFRFTFDKSEIRMSDDEEEKKVLDEEEDKMEKESKASDEDADSDGGSDVKMMLKTILDLLTKLSASEAKEVSESDIDVLDEDKIDKPILDEEEDKTEKKVGDEERTKKPEVAAMDSLTRKVLTDIARRDELANRLSHEIGVLDYKKKTLGEVVSYGMDALRLKAPRGHELTALTSYLAGSKKSHAKNYVAMDSVSKGSTKVFSDFLSTAR